MDETRAERTATQNADAAPVDTPATCAERPVATWVLTPFAVGLLAGGLHQAGGVGALLVAASALTGAWSRTVPTRAALAAVAAGLACGALLAVAARLPLAADHVARLAGSGVVAVEGTITEREQGAARVALVLRVDRVRSRRREGRASGLVGISIAHSARTFAVGSRVRIVGRLRRPRNFDNPGAYDHEAALARRGIHVTMFLWNDESIETLMDGPEHRDAVDRARAALAARIAARTAEPARGYLSAVLLGETRSLDPEVRAALTRTGLAHVVSVSGFHVAVAAGACFVLLRWLLLRSPAVALHLDVRKLASVLGLVPVGAYAAIAGGSVPATRSFLTYATVLAALGSDRPPDAVRALALAAVVLAVASPDIAADVSFELSFASVLALILVGRRRRRSERATTVVRRVRDALVTAILVSAAATLATAPLTAWHFQQISLIAPLANLVCLPLLGPAALLPGLAALPMTAVAPPLADWLLDVAGHASMLGLALATELATPTWAAITTPMPSLLEIGLAYAALALWWCRPVATRPSTARAVRVGLALVATCALADVGYWAWERCADPTLRVTFLSIGQGDAAVVELPGGAGVVVVDGGGFPGDFDPGERLIAPFLRARKILHVDVLALSHPQLDHYGGLAYLAAHFAPRELWWNGLRGTAASFGRLERALAAAGTRATVLRRGMTRHLGPDLDVVVLHPGDLAGLDVNDTSLVLRLRFGRTAVLFTGDIEHGAERTLLAEPTRLASDVLKVPHHGSATSSTTPWLAAVAPRFAVVSSGADNRFGFPAPAVVRRLRAAGATMWNTAEDGAVRVVSDGHDVRVSARRRTPERFEFPQLLW